MVSRVSIVCPARPGTHHGNRVTALRWKSILAELGYKTTIVTPGESTSADCLVALHAAKSAQAIRTFRVQFPERPVILALTGTDLYQDRESADSRRSMQIACRLVVLQSDAIHSLRSDQRTKVHVIEQSSPPTRSLRPHHPRTLRVVVAGHLRHVKDPFRTAIATRKLPASSRIVVHHYGAPLDRGTEAFARKEMQSNPRYRWFGDEPRWVVRQSLAKCWITVLSSRTEGGANVLSESIAAQAPVIATRIPGTTGLLGSDYPALFEVGKTDELRQLMMQCEQNPEFHASLQTAVNAQAYRVSRVREVAAWRRLMKEIGQI